MDFQLEPALSILARTPKTLRAMLEGLSSEWTDATEGPETWSPFIVVGHLIHADRTDWIPRAEVILAQGSDRLFPPFDRFGQFEHVKGRSLHELLDEFEAVRAECLTTVRRWRLTDAQLALEGEHPQFGTVSLRQLLATWVAHDFTHIAQIARVMAKQYRDAVGPWSAFLSIMNR